MGFKSLPNGLLLTKSYYNKGISNRVAIVNNSVAFSIIGEISRCVYFTTFFYKKCSTYLFIPAMSQSLDSFRQTDVEWSVGFMLLLDVKAIASRTVIFKQAELFPLLWEQFSQPAALCSCLTDWHKSVQPGRAQLCANPGPNRKDVTWSHPPIQTPLMTWVGSCGSGPLEPAWIHILNGFSVVHDAS